MTVYAIVQVEITDREIVKDRLAGGKATILLTEGFDSSNQP